MNKPLGKPKPRIAPAIQSVLIALCAYFILFALVAAGITPEQYDIHVGAPASVTVYASKDITDTVTTQRLREMAADQVEPSYTSVDGAVAPRVLSAIEERFLTILQVKREIASASAVDGALLKSVGEKLGQPLDETQLSMLIKISEEDLTSLFDRAESMTRDTLSAILPQGQEASAVTAIGKNLVNESYDSSLVSLVTSVIRDELEPNMLVDEEITQANREKAMDAVDDETVVKGEVIVRQGEIVTEAQYTMISSLGLLADNSFDVPLITGVALLILILMAAMGLYFFCFDRSLLSQPKSILLIMVIFVVSVGLSVLVRALNTYLMPVSLGLLLAALLISPKHALFMNFVLAMLISFLASSSSGQFTMAMFSILIMSVVSGPVVVVITRRRVQRTTTLLAGLMIGAANFLTTLAVGLINSNSVNTVLIYALWAAGGGILSAVFSIGIQPLLEWMFNLVSSAKLLELSNPNQPLLRRMLLEAPGSYHHSIIVANLAEAAADAVGANGLLARVGAYYHDVGKLKRPSYFKENQMGDNPHQRTDPRVSAAILTAHTRDGVQLAQKARIPERVIDIIREHHGDSPVLYFYDKAIKQYGDDVDISGFRYDGPRPRTKESAIVMLADTVEAASRAQNNPDPDALDQLIRKLVRAKMADGQLDESELTFNDLDRICSAFFTVLGGVFHERIEYPDIAIPPRKDRVPEPAAPEKPAEPEEKPAAQAAEKPSPAPAAEKPVPDGAPSEAKPREAAQDEPNRSEETGEQSHAG